MCSKAIFRMDIGFYIAEVYEVPDQSLYKGSMSVWSTNNIDRSSYALRLL